MYKEDVDISDAIKKEISRVIDLWADDLIKNKIATPEMNPSYKRGLWDRVKGSLSNLFYGGRYNTQNPYYWQNRFGDDLGKQESYDPRVFSLKEYKEIKQAIEETENIIFENFTPDVEKLRIVKLIRSSAEELKKKLYDIFVNNCSDPTTSPPDRVDPLPTPEEEEDSGPPNLTGVDSETGSVIPRSAPEAERDAPVPATESKSFKLDKKSYLTWKPKRSKNKGKTLEQLRRKNQVIDLILHEDFQISMYTKVASHILRMIENLEHDAKLYEEREQIIEDILRAKEKFISMLPKE